MADISEIVDPSILAHIPEEFHTRLLERYPIDAVKKMMDIAGEEELMRGGNRQALTAGTTIINTMQANDYDPKSIGHALTTYFRNPEEVQEQGLTAAEYLDRSVKFMKDRLTSFYQLTAGNPSFHVSEEKNINGTKVKITLESSGTTIEARRDSPKYFISKRVFKLRSELETGAVPLQINRVYAEVKGKSNFWSLESFVGYAIGQGGNNSENSQFFNIAYNLLLDELTSGLQERTTRAVAIADAAVPHR